MSRPSNDQAVRSLITLSRSGSTARTLNLHAAWLKHGHEDGHQQRRFFGSPALNRAIIVKHRLRGDEVADFADGRTSATKIIIPIDFTNLGSGAWSFFIGQRQYEAALAEVFKPNDSFAARDREMLACLDTLPSLDPFLMRERLKKEGFEPDQSYFNLSEADAARIFDSVLNELLPLINLSFGEINDRTREKAGKLASKILHNVGDAELEPLRMGLGMSVADFAEGVFCWKGFIYYKWSLAKFTPQVKPVAVEIAAVAPMGSPSAEDQVEIGRLRQQIARSLITTSEGVRASIQVYDEAYRGLTENNPASFRDFLLRAPALFHELGERLGALSHIMSFWRFRFPEGQRKRVEIDELIELLSDFYTSLGIGVETAQPRQIIA